MSLDHDDNDNEGNCRRLSSGELDRCPQLQRYPRHLREQSHESQVENNQVHSGGAVQVTDKL